MFSYAKSSCNILSRDIKMLSPDLFREEDEEQYVANDSQDEHDEDHDPAHRELDVCYQLVTLPELEQCQC